MTRHTTTKINKIPLPGYKKNVDRPKNFPPMPRLYLELIENKEKIRQDLIDREYVPPDYNSISHQFGPSRSLNGSGYNSYNDNREDYSSDEGGYRDEEEKSEDDYELRRGNNGPSSPPSSDEGSDNERNDISDSESDYEDMRRRDHRSRNDNRHEDSSDDDLPNRLKELLREDGGRDEELVSEHYSRKRQRHPKNVPPSLAELEQKGEYKRKEIYRDLNQPNNIELDEDDKKRELLWKFSILKKTYPDAQIEEFSQYSDYNTMLKSYNNEIRRLSLDSTVKQYQQFLFYGFIGVEFILGSVFKFDMAGYSQQQMINMSAYNKCLIER